MGSGAEHARARSAYPPIISVKADIPARQFSARSRLMRRSKRHSYSIASSAMASNDGGTSRPSALAVLRLITNSNLVD
jgi:hypothetical protein